MTCHSTVNEVAGEGGQQFTHRYTATRLASATVSCSFWAARFHSSLSRATSTRAKLLPCAGHESGNGYLRPSTSAQARELTTHAQGPVLQVGRTQLLYNAVHLVRGRSKH